MIWPSDPVVAKAYLDQLKKDKVLDETLVENIMQNLDLADSAILNGSNEIFADNLANLQLTLKDTNITDINKYRLKQLDAVLKEISKRLKL